MLLALFNKQLREFPCSDFASFQLCMTPIFSCFLDGGSKRILLEIALPLNLPIDTQVSMICRNSWKGQADITPPKSNTTALAGGLLPLVVPYTRPVDGNSPPTHR